MRFEVPTYVTIQRAVIPPSSLDRCSYNLNIKEALSSACPSSYTASAVFRSVDTRIYNWMDILRSSAVAASVFVGTFTAREECHRNSFCVSPRPRPSHFLSEICFTSLPVVDSTLILPFPACPASIMSKSG